MIQRIAIKSNNIRLSETSLVIGGENFLTIPLTTINGIKFYPSTELEAGYLAVVKNDFADADIIFFHKKFEETFKIISNQVNSQLTFTPPDIY